MLVAVALFIVAWLALLIYAVSAIRLGLRLYWLKRQERFVEAPDLSHPLERLRAIGWMVTGRYERLEDPIVARWGRLARISLLVAAPLIVCAVVAMAVSAVSANIASRDPAGDRGQQLIGDGSGG